MCGLLRLVEPSSDVRLVHLDATLVEHPIMNIVSFMLLLRRFHFILLLSFKVFTSTQKMILVETLDKKLKLFLILFLEVRERILAFL